MSPLQNCKALPWITGGNHCIQLFRKRLSEKMCTRQSRKEMGYDQYTVPNDFSCRTYFGCFPLAIANITSQTSRAILSNFFEEQCTQNHPQYPSGLSRTLFPTTFLEIAVYGYNPISLVMINVEIVSIYQSTKITFKRKEPTSLRHHPSTVVEIDATVFSPLSLFTDHCSAKFSIC